MSRVILTPCNLAGWVAGILVLCLPHPASAQGSNSRITCPSNNGQRVNCNANTAARNVGSRLYTGVSQPACSTPSGGFAYVANQSSDNVSAYTIDGRTGVLTAVPGSPFPFFPGVIGDPSSVIVDPTGRFAYVAGYFCTRFRCSPSTISAYTIDGSTGALTRVPGSPFPSGKASLSVTVDPTGRFVYVANADSNDVSAYTIDGGTGALTPVR